MLRSFTRGHHGVNASDAELAMAEMAKEGVGGVHKGEYSEDGQREVEEHEVELHVGSLNCNYLGPDDKGGVSCPETVEV